MQKLLGACRSGSPPGVKTAENSAVQAGPTAAISIATNMATKNWKKPLRTLSAAQLQSVSGGIIGILSGSSGSFGDPLADPALSTTFTGGVSYLPAVQR